MSNADPEKQLAKLLAKRHVTETGCWKWPGQRTAAGYGQMRTGPGSRDYVHRISHKLLIGPIPEGTEIDHLCRNRACYNPEHLEAVPHRINWLRGESHAAVVVRTNRCGKGHDMTDAYVTKTTGARRCRPCVRAQQDRYRAKRREPDHAALG
jgi:hypothetical protein